MKTTTSTLAEVVDLIHTHGRKTMHLHTWDISREGKDSIREWIEGIIRKALHMERQSKEPGQEWRLRHAQTAINTLRNEICDAVRNRDIPNYSNPTPEMERKEEAAGWKARQTLVALWGEVTGAPLPEWHEE